MKGDIPCKCKYKNRGGSIKIRWEVVHSKTAYWKFKKTSVIINGNHVNKIIYTIFIVTTVKNGYSK